MVYNIQDLLYIWESYGVFDILLPFLLVFAIVFGILNFTNIFGGNKGINVIIALVIGMLAVRFPFFTQFYQEIFPRLGVGLAVLIVVVILIGIFIPEEHKPYYFWGFAAIAFIIALVAIYQTFDILGWTGFGIFSGEGTVAWIILAIIFIGLIIAVATSGSKESNAEKGIKGTFKKLWEG